MSREEFSRSSMAELNELLKCWEENQKSEDLRCGLLAAAIYNGSFKKENGQPYVPGDFFPRLRLPASTPEDQTPEDQTAAFHNLFGWAHIEKR